VDSEGRSWRSGAIVERKLLRQWFFKITDYAEQLLQDLDKLSGWPDRVKTMQANWIGKSVGAYLEFPLQNADQKIGVFTTRPDTVFGVTYVVLAPEHPLTQQVTTSDRQTQVAAFIAEVAQELLKKWAWSGVRLDTFKKDFIVIVNPGKIFKITSNFCSSE
jgi:leucyl-tRNA synthetase